MTYICWLTDRDGETRGSEEFDSREELLHTWPYAEQESANDPYEYSAWIGGRR